MLEVVVGNILKFKSMIADNGVISTSRNTIPYWRINSPRQPQLTNVVHPSPKTGDFHVGRRRDNRINSSHSFPNLIFHGPLAFVMFFLPHTRQVSIPTSMSPSPSPISLNTIHSSLFDHG